jgi:hypothetical protein
MRLMRTLERATGLPLRELNEEGACFGVTLHGRGYGLVLMVEGSHVLLFVRSKIGFPVDGVPDGIKHFLQAQNAKTTHCDFDIREIRGQDYCVVKAKVAVNRLTPEVLTRGGGDMCVRIAALDETLVEEGYVR